MISFGGGGGGGGGTKEIVDRLHGHGKGEGTGVPSHAKQLFQTLWLNISRVNSKKSFDRSFLQLATFAIPQACIINTELEILGGHLCNKHKIWGGGALAPSAPVLPPPLYTQCVKALETDMVRGPIFM